MWQRKSGILYPRNIVKELIETRATDVLHRTSIFIVELGDRKLELVVSSTSNKK